MKKRLLGLIVLIGGVCLGAQAQEATESVSEKQLLNDFLTAVYAQRNSDPKALAYLEKTLALEPDSKYLKKMVVMQALAENKPQVADRYADFITQGENDAEDWEAYGTYLWKKGRLKEAEEAYQKAIAFDPDDTQRLYPYVMLLTVSNPAKAVEVLEDLAVKYPSMAGAAYTEIGNLFLRRQNLTQALHYFDKAVQVSPDEVNARIGKANVYEKSSQFFLMLHELEELEKMGFGNASTYSRMASVFLLGKDLEKARHYFLKAKEAQKDDIPSSYFLALLSEKQGDFESAIRYLREAADFEQDASKQLQVSFYQQKLNQFNESARTLEQAHQKFPDNVEIAFFYGLALQQIKQYKQAAQVFEKLVEKRPEYTEAWLQYAYTLESLKKYKQMEEAGKRILQLQPNHAPALNLLAYSLAQRSERLEEAQNYISRALAISPQDYAFIDTQAWIYYKQGKLAQAADLLRSIPTALIEQNPEIAYHLGVILMEQGDRAQAISLLKQASDSMPEAARLLRRLEKQP